MNRFVWSCALLSLLLAGCTWTKSEVVSTPGGELPTPAQRAQRCQPNPDKPRAWPPRLQGTMLWGTAESWLTARRAASGPPGTVLSWAELPGGTPAAGAVLPGMDGDGRATEVAICGAQPSKEDPAMVWYQLEVWNAASHAWENPCVASLEVPEPRALAVGGVWDRTAAHHDAAGRVTFACETGAIAKCAKWGYKPWSGGAMADLHQACTRMARADYCGDGSSHTREGSPVDVYDPLGVNQPARSVPPEWSSAFEAAWAPDGASCIARTRDGRPLESVLAECPNRFEAVASDVGDGDRCAVRRSGAGAPAWRVKNRTLTGARPLADK